MGRIFEYFEQKNVFGLRMYMQKKRNNFENYILIICVPYY